MNNIDYSEYLAIFMARYKDKELIRIVTFDKNDYERSWVTAAQEEIKKRNITPKRIEKLTNKLKKKIEKEIVEKEENEKPKSRWFDYERPKGVKGWLGELAFEFIDKFIEWIFRQIF